MAEYLEKSAVIKAIHDEIYSGGNWSGGWYECSEEQAEKNFTERINAITPVTRESGEWEVYEVLHGEWEGTKKYRCSRCKHKVGVFNTNFCPNCGADMRDEKKKMKEIVIKIDDVDYEYIKRGRIIPIKIDNHIYDAIRNGKVLPPGHGELRDTATIVDKLTDMDIYLTDKDWKEIGKALESAEVLVEADKEYKVKVITRGKCMICGKELTEGLFFCKECEAKQVAEKEEE